MKSILHKNIEFNILKQEKKITNGSCIWGNAFDPKRLW